MSETLQALEALRTLSDQIRELQVRSEERLKAQHGRFNVFTTLLSAHDEVRLHTRFIHELLNPDGTHDCGDLFLRLFFETLEDNQPTQHDDSSNEESWSEYGEAKYRVGKEVRKPQGQLDLLLESDSHLLVIENKIWAGEQENQIERYCKYVNSQTIEKTCVLYLTLDGKQAETHNKNAYLRISYREHILSWLDLCLKATYHIIPINQILIQYQRVVKQLTGQSIEFDIMATITDFLRTNPDILKNSDAINEALEKLKFEIRDRFAAALIDSLNDAYLVVYRPGMIKKSFAIDSNAGLVVTPKLNDFTANHPFDIWVEHNKWGALCIGIEAKWKKTRLLTQDEKQLLKIMKGLIKEKCDEIEIHHSSVDKTWSQTFWPTGFHNLIEQFAQSGEDFANLLNDTCFKEQVKITDEGVRKYIELLRSAYNEAKSMME